MANPRPAYRIPKGVTGNPGGRPISKPFLRALERVYEAKTKIGKGEQVPELEALLRTTNRKAQELVEKCKTTQEFIQLLPFLAQLHDWLDGRDAPPAQMEASRESRVYLMGGQVTKEEEVRTVSESVQITGGQNG